MLLHCRPVVTESMSHNMPYLMKVLQRHPLMSDNITYTCVSASIQESDKLLVHPHPDLEQHEQEVKVI